MAVNRAQMSSPEHENGLSVEQASPWAMLPAEVHSPATEGTASSVSGVQRSRPIGQPLVAAGLWGSQLLMQTPSLAGFPSPLGTQAYWGEHPVGVMVGSQRFVQTPVSIWPVVAPWPLARQTSPMAQPLSCSEKTHGASWPPPSSATQKLLPVLGLGRQVWSAGHFVLSGWPLVLQSFRHVPASSAEDSGSWPKKSGSQ